MTTTTQPQLRWGILGTGWISSNFVKDLVLPRPDAPVRHVVQALGTSSLQRGSDFITDTFKDASPYARRPRICTSYEEVYADPEVDVIYIGTPHALHKQNSLDAIAAGKHILCEKPFAINAREAEEVVESARARGVFAMEAVWTRFFPLVRELQYRLHHPSQPLIGRLHRMLFDFGLDMNLAALPSTSRLKNPALGAGALLDIGIYAITAARVLLAPETQPAEKAWDEMQEVTSALVVENGIDTSDVLILRYGKPTRIAVLTTSTDTKTPDEFMRIEGTDGVVVVEGPAGSCPLKATVTFRDSKRERVIIEPKHAGMGFFFEADAVGLDIAAGRTESAIMPLAETLRVLRLMDSIRLRAGVVYPQDEQC